MYVAIALHIDLLTGMHSRIRLQEFSQFVSGYSVSFSCMLSTVNRSDHAAHRYQWVFTLGLALGAVLDVVIAAVLCMYLRKSRTGFSSYVSTVHVMFFDSADDAQSTAWIMSLIQSHCIQSRTECSPGMSAKFPF